MALRFLLVMLVAAFLNGIGNARGSSQTASMTRYGSYSLHAKLFVFDRQRLFGEL